MQLVDNFRVGLFPDIRLGQQSIQLLEWWTFMEAVLDQLHHFAGKRR